MKAFKYVATLIFLISGFFVVHFFSNPYKSEHPTLNETSALTDIHLSNVKYYAKENSLDRSLLHLDQAIGMIREIQTDIDTESYEMINEAIKGLEKVRGDIEKGELDKESLDTNFENALNQLARAELRVSERYAESNRPELAKVALKYANMHLKSSFGYSSRPDFKLEQHIYVEIDSLLHTETVASVILLEKIESIIEEIDNLIAQPLSE
ncbi:MAG: hypothetical protein ACJAVY_001091 [Marinoscillum sp.]|jgi:hypothetical protein